MQMLPRPARSLGKTLRAINLFPDMVEHGRDSDIVRGLVKTVLFLSFRCLLLQENNPLQRLEVRK